MPQSFRDAFACHIYMLYSVMFFMESEAKASVSKRDENKADSAEVVAMRATCADAMLRAAQSMATNRSRLWKCGVPDEAVVGLPCRIAYQMLESATGVVARKAASADTALSMIAATVDSADNLLGTVVAALVDLLHSYEHIASLVAELCTMVNERPTNRLALELMREIGRLDTSASSEAGNKASGVKNVAHFISELATTRPRIVLSSISLILPHMNSEPYGLRSAIATAIGHILVHVGKHETDNEQDDDEANPEEDGASAADKDHVSRSQDHLLDVLSERVYDVSSFTRGAVLKAWINVTQNGALPIERVLPVTALAIDRLQDKTVMVRRSAMQVSHILFMRLHLTMTKTISLANPIIFLVCHSF
jgi:condensin complex subunit 1